MNMEGDVDFSVMALNHESAAYNPQYNVSSETDSEDALAHLLEDVNNVLRAFPGDINFGKNNPENNSIPGKGR